jgi:hypothetical protein
VLSESGVVVSVGVFDGEVHDENTSDTTKTSRKFLISLL